MDRELVSIVGSINTTTLMQNVDKTTWTFNDSTVKTINKENEEKQTMMLNNARATGITYYSADGLKIQLKSDYQINYGSSNEFIYSFEEIIPEHVVVVHFGDGQSEKMVCREPDIFDLHRCLYLAIAKHLYKKEYTTEGIEYKATELSMQKKYVKIVENAINAHNKMLKDQEKAERLEIERIAAKNRRAQKKKEKREQVKELKREEAIEVQKEAYLRAMKEYKSDKKKEK